MPGSYSHLIRRFLETLRARQLDAAETALVATWLSQSLLELFYSQPVGDQRHGLETAIRALAAGGDDPDTLTAALLHDVGKRHSNLGVIGRSFASILIKTGVPISRRMRFYRDHGSLGAQDLAAWGAPPLAVEFAASHHHSRPEGIPRQIWEVLVEADQETKPGAGAGQG